MGRSNGMNIGIRTLIVTLIIPFFIVSPVFAKGPRQPVHVVLSKTQVVNKDYFAVGDTVTISGTVNGDAYVAGGNVLVDGTINGDLLAAGGMVSIDGPVKHNIRVAGGTVIISSEVDGNITAAAGTLIINPGAKILGSLVVGAGNANLFAPVGKGATVGAGNLTVANKIGGDVVAGVGQLALQPNAMIAGSLTYWSKMPTSAATQTQVKGTTLYHQIAQSQKRPMQLAQEGIKGMMALFIGIGVAAVLAGLVITFLIGLIIMSLLPEFTKKTLSVIQDSPWKSLAIGFLSVIAVPVSGVILLLTIIGIPIGILTFMALGLLAYVAHIIGALFIGTWTLEHLHAQAAPVWRLLVGLILFAVVSVVPIIGPFVHVCITLIAMGALVTEKYTVYRQLRAKRML